MLEVVAPFQLACEQMEAQIAEKELEVQKPELFKARMKAEFDQCATLIKSKTYAKKNLKSHLHYGSHNIILGIPPIFYTLVLQHYHRSA